MKYTLIICTFILSYLVPSISNFEEFGPQPRIISSAGHLIFNAADNKNIKFLTKGNGKIFLNQGDLTEAAALAQNASKTLQRIHNDYYDTYFEVQRFKKLLEGQHGILDRLNFIESSSGSFPANTSAGRSPSGTYYDYSVSLINRRLRMLQRKVNRLMLLLTKDECNSNPCKNGGSCQDMFNGFLCRCPTEWEGPVCDQDVNECSRYSGTDLGCQNGATCTNKPGSYECHCAQGWFGIHCTRQSTSCTSGSVAELCGHGTCIPQNNGASYKCLCDQGWTTDGPNLACTKDVDECTSNKPPCSINPPVPCINVPGTFYCGACPQGYTGNGYYCSDLDECGIFNGGCSVNPMVQCINTPGSRMCGACPPGYVGNGESCTFQGICGVNNGGCHHLAQCSDNPRISSTFVECICPSGYIGSGIGPSGCTRTSEAGNPCANNPCVHGTCVPNNLTGTYTCLCNRKFTGRNCEIRKDPCQPNPCGNGGTCRAVFDISFVCICTSAYTGTICEQERQACGGRLSQLSGTLKYPASHSTVYNHLISCAWIIETNFSKVINITFKDFHLDGSNNCRYDWLQIHDGRNSAAHSLGRFCGNALPNGGTIISTHNVLYLWFRSDPSVSHSGFELDWNTINPACGGDVQVTTHGTIHSPGFPGNYPPNRNCIWNIAAPLGKRLQFHFFSLVLGNNPNCTDYLAIYQGYFETNSILAKYCNTSHPQPLHSSGPEVVIEFQSGPRSSNPGFQITYSVVEGVPGCGGIFTANEGELSSPSINGHYPPEIVCEYEIIVLKKSRIKLTFVSFDLEDEENCLFDYVEIHEGRSAQSPLIGKYCGTNLPPSYTSVGNEIFVVFVSDWGNNEQGFRLKYESVCGGIFSEPEGVITSPGYPNPYKEDQTCIYEIIQPLGGTIYLTFTDFELETTSYPECMFDYLEIRDGDNDNSTLIGQYCTESPPDVQSTYNYLWIKFQSDSSISGKGFQANYSTTTIGCGGILKSNDGMLKSPEYPDLYPSSSVCTWIIVAPPGNVIQLTWLYFGIEQSSTCSFDYVEVYNNDTKNELIGKYCGTTLPPTLLSSSNMLTIKFITDSSINFDGFMATYTFMDQSSACGGRYFTSSGVIKTPFYPQDYPLNRDCTWIITVNHGQQILLNMTDFSLESYTNCNYDYLEIRNGGTASSPLIGKYCGTKIPKQIPSHANQLYLFFKSDMSHTSTGFKITWDSTTTGCGGILTSPRGSLISPFYPEPYNRNTDCFWRISVSAGSLIQILFADLDLEDHMNCAMDYVEIFDGSDTSSKSLGKFCFTVNVPFIRSSSNHVAVVFRSDTSFQKRGFHIQYSTVCQNTLKGFRGVIESPNFPNGYPQDQDCRWKIEVPMGNKINITFSHFELERSTTSLTKNCSFDYLEIKYKGSYYDPDEDMLVYDTYCGSNIPPLIPIHSNIVEIHFQSDNLLIGSGFRLEWLINGCGGKLTHPSDTISTPNYPNGYPTDTICEWIIQVDYGTSIEISFTHIDMEASNNCIFDYILIANGPDESYATLTKICSQRTKPIIVTSTGNVAFIKFHSDSSYRGRGFTANYTSVPSKCGGKLTAPSGSFHSPNYPKNYDQIETCEWFIDIEDNHLIQLTFEDVDLAGECNLDYIKVFDGPTAAYPVLATICGNSKPNETITSTRNQMFIEMRTSEHYSAKGFLANYTLGCGARIVTQNSGIILATDVSLFNDVGTCSWTIVSSIPSQHVSLIITHMENMECYFSSDYETDYPVRIYGGENNQSPIIAKFCDKKLPPTIISSGNALHIEIDRFGINFIAKYSMMDSACGGVLTGITGGFTTPRYPDPYPSDIQCEWTIQVAAGNKITLSFLEFDLISSDKCNFDYLEIRSESSGGKLLGTFCEGFPTNITNIGSLWLLFKSSKAVGVDSSFTGKGFSVEYSLIHGVELSGPSGQIASPLYPNYCLESDTFTWRISVTFGKRISITFRDFFVEGTREDDMYTSTLEAYDGFDDIAPIISILYGANNPDPIKSTSNLISLKLKCNTFGHGSKFLLDWLEVEGEIKIPTVPKLKAEKCGSEEVIDMSDTYEYQLTSPGYPHGYAQNLQCEWIFSTSQDYHLIIDFWKVDVENIIGQCLLDTIKVYTGKDGAQDWDLVATVCFPNATRQNEIATSNLMKVEFRSDHYMNGSGFEADVKKICGGSITGSNGILSANSSETGYEDECQWNVSVRAGRTIEVTFLKLDLETNRQDQCHNYVMFKNGHYAESPILGKGKYCDNIIPEEPLYTTGSHLWIKFRAGHGMSFFSLKYREVSLGCGGTITLSKLENVTHISSPNYPNIPPPFSECFWTIIAPPGESLRVDFEERFDITASDDCSIAAVEIRDGGSKHSPLLGKYCEELPSSTFSSDNMLHIRFFTDVKEPRNGFKALISIATCGGVIRSQVGEIHSPNFNNKKLYPKNSDCIWRIIGPQDHYLILNFNTLDLPASVVNCSTSDHVSLEERFFFNNTIRPIDTYCGNEKPGEISSSTNEVIVHLITGDTAENVYAGFSVRFNSSLETCGGNINTEDGMIESPGYPQSFYHKRECEWLITVPEGRRITFEFIDMDIDFEGYDEGIAFFNDINYRSSIAFTKDVNITQPIQSSSNTLYVLFWGFHSANYRGFQARYSSNEPSICQGDFSRDSGIISHINSSSYYCTWKHNFGSAKERTISMSIIMNFAVPTTDPPSSCGNGGVIVASENEKDVILRLCKSIQYPVLVRSPYPITELIGYQDVYPPLLQYTITYTTHQCGGIVTDQQGSITTPGFPNKYSQTVECTWLLKLPQDQQIKLSFENVNLDTNCDLNYIIIYNGNSPASPRIGRFCHNNKPGTVTSQDNTLWIEYHADEQSSGTGFKTNYEPIIGGCGGIFHDNSRVIETPSYPKDYPNNTECEWQIIPKNGYHIILEFSDRFYIEESDKCEKDYVEVWDYKDKTWRSLGRKCGREIPHHINSTSNKMKILFRSNDKIRATGFKAKWSLRCGGTFIADERTRYIVSPGYPNEYNNSLLCVYEIMAPKSYVNVEFEDFLLEQDTSCHYDNVSIQPITPMGTYIAHLGTPKYYCGTTKPPVLRQYNGVSITFATDSWVTRRGFKLSYKTDSCGGVITQPTTVASPVSKDPTGTNKLYVGAIDCSWNITAPQNKNVVVRFLSFELEHNPYCSYDFLAMYDGLTTNETYRLALLCGNLSHNLPTIKSRGNSMTIVMKTDHTNHFSGFRALIYFNYGPNVGCGGSLIVDNIKTLEAPTGLPNLDCHWEIITTKDYILNISFNELHLGPCTSGKTIGFGLKNCSCSFIEIRDGAGSFSELIDQLCDNELPRTYTTSGHTAWLRLYTIEDNTNKAFRVTLTKTPSICGPSTFNVTNQTQVLTSPGYPNSYPNNIKCTWVLKSYDFLEKFDMHFTDFDLAKLSSSDVANKKCEGDRVEIYDKMNQKLIYEGLGTATVFSGSKSAPIYGGHRMPVGIHQFCGHNALSFDHYSGQNEVVISFYSSNNPRGKGFQMEYRLTGCNRNFTSVQGRIANSKVKGSCYLTITAPENYTISLYFMTFIMYDVSNCETAGFQVHDGESHTAPQIAKLCGYTTPNPIFSTKNKLWIHVWNNNDNSIAFYDAVYTSSSAKGCGGIFYNYAGKFTSPMYPLSYREDNTCTWEITVPQNLQVALKFTVFDIAGICHSDRIEVTTFSHDETSATVHRFCRDENPAVLQSESNRMVVTYTTTVNNGGTGWVAQFMAVSADTNLNWQY